MGPALRRSKTVPERLTKAPEAAYHTQPLSRIIKDFP